MKKNKKNKFRIKKGDQVAVIAGNHKGKKDNPVLGKIKQVDSKNNRVIIEGINMVKRHTKPTASKPEGGIIEKEAGIHVSNVMVFDPVAKSPSRIAMIMDEKTGKYKRIYKKSGELIK